YQAALNHDTHKVAELKGRIGRLLGEIDVLEFPLNVAAAMAARGLAVGEPKTPLSSQTRSKLERVISTVRALYEAWELTLLSNRPCPSIT
ncbi:MAG: hypothetical protein N3G20_03310, partial [Verrucomicrobiae bacterium]|nr:hypothetical protein [Verrucomicrobiae bacterium]